MKETPVPAAHQAQVILSTPIPEHTNSKNCCELDNQNSSSQSGGTLLIPTERKKAGTTMQWNNTSSGTICLSSLPAARSSPKQWLNLPRASHYKHFTDLTKSSPALWQWLTATKRFLTNTPNQPDCKQWHPQRHFASWSFKMYWRWQHGLLSPRCLLCRVGLLHC